MFCRWFQIVEGERPLPVNPNFSAITFGLTRKSSTIAQNNQ
jgi:hypothetical protein